MRRYFRAVLGEVHKKDAEKKREKRLEKYRGGGITLHLLERLCVDMLVGAKTIRLRYAQLWRLAPIMHKTRRC